MPTRPVPPACGQQHPLDEANTYVDKTGKWHCRKCQLGNYHRHADKAKAEREVERQRKIDARPTWSALDLAWAAGIFEGEGTVTILNGGRQGYTRSIATVTSTDPDVLRPFQRMWPGQYRSVGHKSANAREAWTWGIEGDTLMAFLLDVRPHIRTARVAAKFDLMLEVQRLRRPGSRDPEYKAKLMGYREKMRVLNRRGRQEPGSN